MAYRYRRGPLPPPVSRTFPIVSEMATTHIETALQQQNDSIEKEEEEKSKTPPPKEEDLPPPKKQKIELFVPPNMTAEQELEFIKKHFPRAWKSFFEITKKTYNGRRSGPPYEHRVQGRSGLDHYY